MTDRRRLRFNGRIAHDSLRGAVAAESFTAGSDWRVTAPRATLFPSEAAAARDRELILGEVFTVLERRGPLVFGFAARDGHVGWMEVAALSATAPVPSHRITTRHSYAKASPSLKTMDDSVLLPHGARVAVLAEDGPWRQIALGADRLWMPAAHLTPVDRPDTDPIEVAELYLGTPYLWGGNSAFGIDCSGLVQAALLACGLPCPGDSDQQERELGAALPAETPARRGDLFFWTGHVAMALDTTTLIHANAHHMAVAHEPIADAMSRILDQGGGPITAHKRL